jgi:hypothetical protein
LFFVATFVINNMPRWNEFKPKGFEYDFENDELYAHSITIEEAIQCFNHNGLNSSKLASG